MVEVDISVVLPTYNRSEMLRGAIESLVSQETDERFSFEIVVVDNASTDSTKSTVQHLAAVSPIPVRYVFEEVPGDAHARNRGVSEARADWLAFMDDDELAERDWLKQLYMTALEKEAAVVGGVVRLDLSEEQNQTFGRACRKALRETEHRKEAVHRCTGNSLPATGNALIKRSVFDLLGLFDTSMAAGGSDSDFVLRARAAGYDLWHTPNAIVHHRLSAHRLTPAYFKWDSQRDGITLAYLDLKYKGRGKTALFCVARIGQALVVNLPLLVWAYLSGDRPETLGRESLLWRAAGYVRECVFLLAPNIFPQKRLFGAYEFRRERQLFPGASSPAEGEPPK